MWLIPRFKVDGKKERVVVHLYGRNHSGAWRHRLALNSILQGNRSGCSPESDIRVEKCPIRIGSAVAQSVSRSGIGRRIVIRPRLGAGGAAAHDIR